MRLHDFLDYRAREQPDATFAEQSGRRLTYREARDATCRIARMLAGYGLEIGDRVAMLSKNSIEMLLFYYGASRAGVVPVPLNFRLAPPEWAYIVDDARAKMLFAEAAFVDALAPVQGDLPRVERRVVIGGAAAGWESWEAVVGAEAPTDPERPVRPEDDVYQMYTSGTTGRPKGAILTHAAVAGQLHQALVGIALRDRERVLIVAPLYHAAAAVTALAAVQSGGTLVVQADFDPAAVIDALSNERIGMVLLVPVMIQFCLMAVPDVRERRYDDLRLIVYGASPIAEQTLRDALEVFKCDFLQGYGMTETTAAVTYLLPQDHRRALAGEPQLLLAAGRAMLGTQVRIVDEHDRPVPNGTIGEIVARGPQLMRGYWNLEEASAQALRGGWMHTGDAGIMDEEGYVYVQDRVKDMIVSGGENVYPREVEEVLYQHPGVAEAAVIGVPSEQWGEEVKALVVRKAGSDVTADALVEFCKGRLGGYKRPRSVDFVDALPRNPSGKVLKKELREPYWRGHERRVG
jgi:acyl-CoA synthetase (AMP-forming)/AMP-acid ligase II